MKSQLAFVVKEICKRVAVDGVASFCYQTGIHLNNHVIWNLSEYVM